LDSKHTLKIALVNWKISFFILWHSNSPNMLLSFKTSVLPPGYGDHIGIVA